MNQNSNDTVKSAVQKQAPVNESGIVTAQAPVSDMVQPAAQNVQPKPKKKSKKPLIIIIIILIVLIGLGIGGFFLHRHLTEESDSRRKNRDKKESNKIIDITDYDAVVEEPTEEKIVYDGPEEGIFAHIGVSSDEKGDFQQLRGNFDRKITSQEDALQFIADYSEKITIRDPFIELSFIEEQEYNGIRYYKFQQIYQGIPVYGNQLIVTVNRDGMARTVTGTYTPLNISTDVSVSKEEAEEAAKEYLGGEAIIISSALTVVPHTESGYPKLAYDIHVISTEKAAELFIDAANCVIFDENKLYSEAMEAVDVNVDDSVYHVELDEVISDVYNIYDSTRDITVSDAGSTAWTTITVTQGIIGGMKPIIAMKLNDNPDGSINLFAVSVIESLRPIVENIINDAKPGNGGEVTTFVETAKSFIDANVNKLTECAIGSLSSMQTVYDYYLQNHNWKSIDGNGMPLKIILGSNLSLYESVLNGSPESSGNRILDIILIIMTFKSSDEEVQSPAYVNDSNIMFFNNLEGKPLVGTGVIAHEFTHGVMDNIANLESNDQAKIINEGYADTMASIISGDWDYLANSIPKEWQYYTYNARSASDPNKYGNPAKNDASDQYYEEKPSDVHHNATIISHSAYLMTQKGLSNEQVAEIFFGSMRQLSQNPDYEEAAIAVMTTAELLSYSKEDMKAIADSFIETRMYKPEGKVNVYVHCGSTPLPDAEIMINGAVAGRTDSSGLLILDYDSEWISNAKINAEAEGFIGETKNESLMDDEIILDFNLSVDESFEAADSSDTEATSQVSDEKVKVTILAMSTSGKVNYSKKSAQDFYVQKGSRIDLQKLVDAMGMKGITTDGIKIYFDTGYIPVELSYYIHETDEIFYFNMPVYEDVVIEPHIGIGGLDLGGSQDLNELAEELDGLFNGGD